MHFDWCNLQSELIISAECKDAVIWLDVPSHVTYFNLSVGIISALKVFGYSLKVYFELGKILNLIGQIFMILNKFSLLLMAQYWKGN